MVEANSLDRRGPCPAQGVGDRWSFRPEPRSPRITRSSGVCTPFLRDADLASRDSEVDWQRNAGRKPFSPPAAARDPSPSSALLCPRSDSTGTIKVRAAVDRSCIFARKASSSYFRKPAQKSAIGTGKQHLLSFESKYLKFEGGRRVYISPLQTQHLHISTVTVCTFLEHVSVHVKARVRGREEGGKELCK